MRTIKRRRKQSKTDYGKRIKLLKSGFPRIVFRKTNTYVLSQYVETKEAQDKVIFGFCSKDLFRYGWPKEFENSLKSIPAAYLLGFLSGKRIQKEKLKTPLPDFGMSRMVHKTKVYAFLKGLIDSGLELKYKKDIFPDENKLSGKNLKKDFSSEFSKIKSKIEKE